MRLLIHPSILILSIPSNIQSFTLSYINSFSSSIYLPICQYINIHIYVRLPIHPSIFNICESHKVVDLAVIVTVNTAGLTPDPVVLDFSCACHCITCVSAGRVKKEIERGETEMTDSRRGSRTSGGLSERQSSTGH